MNLSNLSPVTCHLSHLMRLSKGVCLLILCVSLVGFGFLLSRRAQHELLRVVCRYPGASAQQIDVEVVGPILEGLAGTPGILELEAASRTGEGIVKIKIDPKADANWVWAECRSRLDSLRGDLPDDMPEPFLKSGDGAEAPPKADQPPAGAERAEEEWVVSLDPDAAVRTGLPPSALARVLKASNLNLPLGEIREGRRTIPVRLVGELQEAEDLSAMPVPPASAAFRDAGQILNLSDISRAARGPQHVKDSSRADALNLKGGSHGPRAGFEIELLGKDPRLLASLRKILVGFLRGLPGVRVEEPEPPAASWNVRVDEERVVSAGLEPQEVREAARLALSGESIGYLGEGGGRTPVRLRIGEGEDWEAASRVVFSELLPAGAGLSEWVHLEEERVPAVIERRGKDYRLRLKGEWGKFKRRPSKRIVDFLERTARLSGCRILFHSL